MSGCLSTTWAETTAGAVRAYCVSVESIGFQLLCLFKLFIYHHGCCSGMYPSEMGKRMDAFYRRPGVCTYEDFCNELLSSLCCWGLRKAVSAEQHDGSVHVQGWCRACGLRRSRKLRVDGTRISQPLTLALVNSSGPRILSLSYASVSCYGFNDQDPPRAAL
jgi:hypothetical protein